MRAFARIAYSHSAAAMDTTLSPRKLPRQARSQATVDALLDATAQVLVERGYARTTTNAVAERAGVSVGSLYQYFPNKDALVAALHERHVQNVLAVMEQQVERHAGTPLVATLTRLVEASVQAHRDGAELHRVLEAQLGHVELHDHDDLDRRVGALLQRLLEDHRDELAVKDLKLAAFTLQHVVHALVHAMVFDRPSGLSLRAATEEIVRVAVGYLGCGR
jgi:AcrR family transcriptional regulator